MYIYIVLDLLQFTEKQILWNSDALLELFFFEKCWESRTCRRILVKGNFSSKEMVHTL